MQAPLTFRNILVGVDAHGLAADAALQGLMLSEELGSELRFLHAVDLPTSIPRLGGSDLAAVQAKLQVRSREEALASLGRAAAGTPFAGRDFDALLDTPLGHPARAILDRAEEMSADLILLGRHEQGSAVDLGSTVRAVLSRANVPVWAQVRKAKPIQRILVAVDFSEHGKRALELAKTLAQRLGASIHAFHGFTPPSASLSSAFADAFPGPKTFPSWQESAERQELEQLVADFESEGVKVEAEVAEGVPQELILARADRCDLVVMGTHGRTGLSRFLLGSVTHAVMKKAHVPVLVVPSPKTDWLLTAAEQAAAISATT